jgi:hypothetical protein
MRAEAGRQTHPGQGPAAGLNGSAFQENRAIRKASGFNIAVWKF